MDHTKYSSHRVSIPVAHDGLYAAPESTEAPHLLMTATDSCATSALGTRAFLTAQTQGLDRLTAAEFRLREVIAESIWCAAARTSAANDDGPYEYAVTEFVAQLGCAALVRRRDKQSWEVVSPNSVRVADECGPWIVFIFIQLRMSILRIQDIVLSDEDEVEENTDIAQAQLHGISSETAPVGL